MSAPAGRDLRLDLFRGLALWLIFLDHIPANIVNWLTIRNYGFSDAAEIFVFISGYTAAFVYGRTMEQRGVVVASARILKRAWTVYVAHIFIFVIFMAEIAYLTRSIDNPLYNEEMGALDFMKEPGDTLIQALLLKFKPTFMDVLPLYIVLLIGFPPVLWLLRQAPTLALLASVALYTVSWNLSWNLPSYPTGVWYFNPLTWQLIFVFGAWCGLGGVTRLGPFVRSRWVLGLAAAYLAVLVPDRDDVVLPAPCGPHPEVVPGLDVPDRQDQHGRLAIRPLHRAGHRYRAFHSGGLAWIEVRLAQTDDFMRPTLARNLLPGHFLVVSRAFRDLGVLPVHGGAGPDQRVRHSGNDWGCVADHVVQGYRGERLGETTEAVRRGPRGRRGMRRVAGLTLGILAYAAAAHAGSLCDVAAHLVHADAALPRAADSIAKSKALKIVVIGTTSSTLPGANGEALAYPARLEIALRKKLPEVNVKVISLAKPRQTAADMAEGVAKILRDEKPALVIWQTGTYDAMRGVGADNFQTTLEGAVDKLQAGGADVIFMNMQYSPRTEAVISTTPYADAIRWVALEHAVNVFDRQAIMRHWGELGTFDLLTATKSLDTAAKVHDCFGSMLAGLIVEALARDADAPKEPTKQ